MPAMTETGPGARRATEQDQAPHWRGIFTIPVTPFGDDTEIDADSLRNQLDFCVEAGAAGIVHPVMASEFFTLTDEERLGMMPLVTRQVAGRIPVVLGVAATSTQGARRFAAAARDAGADAVIAMPPYVTRYAADDVLRYFEAVARAAEVPVFVQNAGVAAMNPATLLKLVREVPGVHYVKEEVAPAHHNIARLAEAREPGLRGIFGGGGAQNLLDELRRGGAGNMPASQYTDVVSRVFSLWEAGRESEARELHMRLQPALQRERLAGVASAKAVLVKRGIIRSERTRGAGTPLDSYDRAELDAIWPQIEALFSWKR
jgi:4-hydroxy-tetrahydrodipicolinate synthase